MTIYSIDLGIDPSATAGHAGDEHDPYPMQILLSSGILENGDFVPQQLRSWFQFRSSPDPQQADQLLVRVFDLGSDRHPGTAPTLLPPTLVELVISHLDGKNDKAWDPRTATACSEMAAAPSLSYVNPDGQLYRCCQPQAGGQGLRYLLDRPLAAPIHRLLTLRAKAPVSTDGGVTFADKNFRSDPEVIVSPYGG